MKIGQRIVRNQQVQRDRTFLNNKLDIIIPHHKEGKCALIVVAISGDRNVVKTAAEEILKYKDLTIGIEQMWDVKTKEIPLITGANRVMSVSIRKYRHTKSRNNI